MLPPIDLTDKETRLGRPDWRIPHSRADRPRRFRICNWPAVLLPNLHFWEVWEGYDSTLVAKAVRILLRRINFGYRLGNAWAVDGPT